MPGHVVQRVPSHAEERVAHRYEFHTGLVHGVTPVGRAW